MKKSTDRRLMTATLTSSFLVMSGLAAVPTASGATEPAPGTPTGADAREIRTILTNEFGVDRPQGVAWDPERQVFLVTGATRAGGTKLVGVSPAEAQKGSRVLPSLEDADTAAFDPRAKRLTLLQDGGRAVVTDEGSRPRPWKTDRTAGIVGSIDPAGATYSPDGTWYALDASTRTVVSVSPDGRADRLALRGLEDVELRGLAYQPAQDRLYVADADAETLYALNRTGDVVRTQDLSGAGIADLKEMTFAPSTDTTDPVREQNLFVADAGDSGELGSITEVSLTAAVVGSAAGYAVDPTSTVTRPTSVWSPPSPDPSGITYLGDDELLVSDAEVNEMPIYAGANLWVANTDGTQAGGTGTSLPWSDEPAGLEYRESDGHLFVSDDTSPAAVYEVAGAGGDGIFGTADDGARTDVRASLFGSTDPEGVAYDSERDDVLVIDGVNVELFRIGLGANAALGGGDDVHSQVDVAILGMDDPEGITYDEVRDTVVVVDKNAIWELDENGSLLGTIDLSGLRAADKLAGITVAPASDGSGERHYYIVDRGVDNNSDPNENDGMIHEVGADLPDVTNRPPTVDAGPDRAIDLGETAQLAGTAQDDGVPNGTLTYQWSRQSGPGVVTFGGAAAASTTATFSAAGTYTLRLTVSDSQLTAFDDVVVTVHTVGSARTVSIPVAVGSDDAREGTANGGFGVNLTRAHNRLGQDIDPTLGPYPVTIGLRFAGIPVPQGSEVVSAKIQFRTESVFTGPSSLRLRGEASDNAVTFAAVNRNISSRPSTAATVSWAPPVWNTVGASGPDQLTPELAPILQEVVDRPGWAQGNAAAFVVTGTGTRSAESFEGGSAPRLVLQYRMDPGAGAVVSLSARLRHSLVPVGASTAVVATVSPSTAGQPLHLQRWNGSAWRTVLQTTLAAGPSVSHAFPVRHVQSGVYRYRVVAPAHGATALAVAPASAQGLPLRVHRTAITTIRHRAELVKVKNTGVVSVSLKGWRLKNARTGRTATLPTYTLRPGRVVRIHTGAGARRGNHVYLGLRPMWGRHATAVLYDPLKRRVARYRY